MASRCSYALQMKFHASITSLAGLLQQKRDFHRARNKRDKSLVPNLSVQPGHLPRIKRTDDVVTDSTTSLKYRCELLPNIYFDVSIRRYSRSSKDYVKYSQSVIFLIIYFANIYLDAKYSTNPSAIPFTHFS